ncbi:MAG TPA: SDR family oxidoreductase [Marmoricola sp.]|nr:SDR family oxidoreductase [Marmoricola sp.]
MSRVVVVTGAASGIGYATAELFRDAGDTVYALDVSDTMPEGVIRIICDVSSKVAVQEAIATVAAQHDRIDVLANVAGVVQFGRFENITEAEFDRVHAINAKGPFLLIQAALPLLRAAKGAVVNVSSVAGNMGQPYAAAYSSSKGGLTMLTKALAMELSPDGIRVNALCPGSVDTPLVAGVAANFPTDIDPRVADRLMALLPGPAISPKEAAETIVFLASPATRMMSGAIIALDGAMS